MGNDTDIWFGVEDARKRKQIQDRLAQRARRKRLAEANRTAHTSSEKDSTNGLQLAPKVQAADQRGATEACLEVGLPTSGSIPESTGALESRTAITPPSVCPFSAVVLDHFWLPALPSLSVYAALYNNGRILGIPCLNKEPVFVSRPVTSEVPLPLHPTPMQLTTPHSPFIDRFPFMRMRDNMISLTGLLDEEDFIADLFSMTSFTLTPGGASWDPEAWKMSDEFGAKWGYLLY